jgi:hypothetical protein
MKNRYLKKLLLSTGILLSATVTIQKLSAADETQGTEVSVDEKTIATEETTTDSTAETPTSDDSISITFNQFEKLQKVMMKASENADTLNKDFNNWITEITTIDSEPSESGTPDENENK